MSVPTTHHGIAVGVDGSPPSKVAVDWAAREASLRGLPLTLVHVIPSSLTRMWPQVPTPPELQEWHELNGHEILRQARQVAEDAIESRNGIDGRAATSSPATRPQRLSIFPRRPR